MEHKVNNEGLILELPIRMDTIVAMEYEQKFSEHATIFIKGILSYDESVKNVYGMGMQDTITLKQKEQLLFLGVSTGVELHTCGEVTTVEIYGKSQSIRLDMERKKRSFQKRQTYLELMESVIGKNGIICMPRDLASKKTEHLIVQYRETDWEFIKRLASDLHVPVCPRIDIEKNGLYIGAQQGKEIEEKNISYEIKKNVGEYMRYHAQDSSSTETEFTTLSIRSYCKYKIGDRLILDGKEFMIVSICMKYTDGLVRYQYKLCNKKGLRQRKKYLSSIVGASINGEIIKVKKDSVKLHLDIDKEQAEKEALWFPVAIGYTAEGSTGLYTAMDEGERVKLFFPSADEKDAYVRCVNKKDSESSQHFSDPVTKCYGTPYGSCMQATKDGFLISSVKDEIFIKMGEADGITLESAENINIYTEKELDLTCRKLHIQSQDKVIFHTEGSSIIVDETMHFKARG